MCSSDLKATNGVQEKDVVFEFSRGLQALLEATGRYRVIATRASDVFIPLDDRVKIARDAGAALFVSIHADIIGYEPGVSGATVYTGAEKASDTGPYADQAIDLPEVGPAIA